MANTKEFLEGQTIIIERALKEAPAIKQQLDAEAAREAELKANASKEKTTGFILFTDAEIENATGINKILMEQFNAKRKKKSEFIDFLVANGYQENNKKAESYVGNKIKIFRENCDQKFSSIVAICKFLDIQLDFIIN